MKALAGLIAAILLILAIADAASTAAAGDDPCRVERNIILPDTCTGECAGVSTCFRSESRPYLIFFRQAEACDCGVEVSARAAPARGAG